MSQIQGSVKNRNLFNTIANAPMVFRNFNPGTGLWVPAHNPGIAVVQSLTVDNKLQFVGTGPQSNASAQSYQLWNACRARFILYPDATGELEVRIKIENFVGNAWTGLNNTYNGFVFGMFYSTLLPTTNQTQAYGLGQKDITGDWNYIVSQAGGFEGTFSQFGTLFSLRHLAGAAVYSVPYFEMKIATAYDSTHTDKIVMLKDAYSYRLSSSAAYTVASFTADSGGYGARSGLGTMFAFRPYLGFFGRSFQIFSGQITVFGVEKGIILLG